MSKEDRERIAARFSNRSPHQWGINVRGIRTRLATDENVMALTFDACGDSKEKEDYDRALISYLIQEKIQATLFLSALWIDAHREAARSLSQNPLFEIENHGFRHRPLSVTGNKAYGIRGTRSAREAVDEIMLGADKILELADAPPRYFRSGTAHCDDVGVEIADALGMEVVNFTVNGDAGASLRSHQIKAVLMAAPPGSIVIFHMNRPRGETAKGLKLAVPALRSRGVRFVKLP